MKDWVTGTTVSNETVGYGLDYFWASAALPQKRLSEEVVCLQVNELILIILFLRLVQQRVLLAIETGVGAAVVVVVVVVLLLLLLPLLVIVVVVILKTAAAAAAAVVAD